VPKEESNKERFTRHQNYNLMSNELTEDDLELLKFKSLLKAKEYGWDVKLTDIK
jgi:hypothetical protein